VQLSQERPRLWRRPSQQPLCAAKALQHPRNGTVIVSVSCSVAKSSRRDERGLPSIAAEHCGMHARRISTLSPSSFLKPGIHLRRPFAQHRRVLADATGGDREASRGSFSNKRQGKLWMSQGYTWRTGGTAWARTQQKVRSCNALASGVEGLVLCSAGARVVDAMIKAPILRGPSGRRGDRCHNNGCVPPFTHDVFSP
jgi:hypothetical protein